jgi:hypothetical protein
MKEDKEKAYKEAHTMMCILGIILVTLLFIVTSPVFNH